MSQRNLYCRPEPLLSHALRLHRLGASVIPVKAGTKKGAIRWKRYQRERADASTLRDWFADADSGNLGIGVVLGEVSEGLLVRDFDDLGAYHTLVRTRPEIARTLPTVQTNRGYHVWFRCRDYRQGNTRTFLWKYADGELRGDGHIVVVPPSIHAKTRLPYRWHIALADSIPTASLSELGLAPPLRDVTQEMHVLHLAHEDFTSSTIPRIIEATLPRGPGVRHRRIFDFVRLLKAYSEVAGRDARELEDYVRQWHACALPNIRTKEFDETYADFRDAWERVKWPAGVGSLQAALTRAKSLPIPPEAGQFRHEKRLLVALCYQLQCERGVRPFFLSCRDAAQALDLEGREPHVTAWRWLENLCNPRVGILQKVSSGTWSRRKANEYLYLPVVRGPPVGSQTSCVAA